MNPAIDYTRNVRYELMHGRDAVRAIEKDRLGFLPIGCLERHGDHLPMGLDTMKAHGICCIAAQHLGGVVFPPHYYSGIHMMTEEQLDFYTGGWGNIYTDSSAEDHLVDIIRQIGRAGIRTLVLYSGHYPACQMEMMGRVAERVHALGEMQIIPFAESCVKRGEHAGVSETSLMLYLDKAQVDMTRIGPENYRDHGWSESSAPELSTAARGEEDVMLVISALRQEIEKRRASISEACREQNDGF